MTILHRLLILTCALSLVAWTDIPRSNVVEGNRLFHEGKFNDATEQYGQALVDHPDSLVLNFNMGAAHYKSGKYRDALSSFSRVQPGDEDAEQDSPRASRPARTAYNTGNAHYKMGADVEEQNPQAALAAYADALASYRRALGADPTDQDTKFNYEFVTKKMEELREKLENQPQENQQSQQDQEDQQNQKNQQDQQQSQGQNQDQQQDQQQAEQEAGQNQQDQQKQQDQQANNLDGPASQDEPTQQTDQANQSLQDQENDMSSDEAQSVIDTARNEELSPEEFARQAQRGSVAEALRDW